MGATPIWLTEQTYQQLRGELRELLSLRETAGDGSGEPDGTIDGTRDREQRIRRLQELLSDPVVGHRPPDDGIAEPGMAVTLRYDDGDEETLLLSHDEDRSGTTMVCSPDAPLGRALHGARQGDHVRYPLPGGGTGGATLLRVVPYLG